MTKDTASLIRDSFNLLKPRADELVQNFYDRLFATAPTVRTLFPADMTQQRKHLVAAIATVVQHVDHFENLETSLAEMGARHVGYGATSDHYGVVRDTLLATMKDMAGTAWTRPIEEAWTTALNAVASAMLRGAEQAKKKAA